MVVTDGNGNGKVRGTSRADIIFGTASRSNIIDGRGGKDQIVGGEKNDLIEVSNGDLVDAQGDNDLLFFDFDDVPQGYWYNTTAKPTLV